MNPVDNLPEFIRWFYQSAVSAAVSSKREQFRRYHIHLCGLPADQREKGKQYNRMLSAKLYEIELCVHVDTLESAFDKDLPWWSLYGKYLDLDLVTLNFLSYTEVFDRIRIKLGLPKIPGQP